MAASLYILLHESGERFTIGRANHTSAELSQYRALMQGKDVEASRTLRFANELEAQHVLTTLSHVLRQWDITESFDSIDGSRWFASDASLALHQYLNEAAELICFETLPVNQYFGKSVDLADTTEPLVPSVEEILNEAAVPTPATDVAQGYERLLAQAIPAMQQLRKLCGENLALMPQTDQLGFELVGIFGAENFDEAMAALGTLESDVQQVLFTDHALSEIGRVRTQIDWAFCIKVTHPTQADQIKAGGALIDAALRARMAFAAVPFQIPGWDLALGNVELLDEVRQAYFHSDETDLDLVEWDNAEFAGRRLVR